MSDVRTILERGVGGTTPPPDGYERMLRRRDRKRRNQRIRAGVVGLAIALAAFAVGTHIIRSSSVPAVPPEPTVVSPWIPVMHNGPITVSNGGVLVGADPKTGEGVKSVAASAPGGETMDSDWSADGKRLLFVVDCAGGCHSPKNYGLYVRDLATGEQRQLLKGGRTPLTARWSPDGTQIAYIDYAGQLNVMNADGSANVTIPVTPPADLLSRSADSVSWSPDGTRLAFGVQGQDGLYTVGLDGSDLQRVVDHGQVPSWSPDGTQIAYRVDCGLWVVSPDGSNPTKVADTKPCGQPLGGASSRYPVGQPRWSPNGKWIVLRGPRAHVSVVRADGTHLHVPDPGLISYWAGPSWRPVP
jgi:dipeptidyl aminopeptidase/acylaminoacyl peptidase